MSSEDIELNSSADDVITEKECQKIVADAIKQSADKDQEDLTAYSTSPVISPDHDLKPIENAIQIDALIQLMKITIFIDWQVYVLFYYSLE